MVQVPAEVLLPGVGGQDHLCKFSPPEHSAF